MTRGGCVKLQQGHPMRHDGSTSQRGIISGCRGFTTSTSKHPSVGGVGSKIHIFHGKQSFSQLPEVGIKSGGREVCYSKNDRSLLRRDVANGKAKLPWTAIPYAAVEGTYQGGDKVTCNFADIVLEAREGRVSVGLHALNVRVLSTSYSKERAGIWNPGGKLRRTDIFVVFPVTHCRHQSECGVLTIACSDLCHPSSRAYWSLLRGVSLANSEDITIYTKSRRATKESDLRQKGGNLVMSDWGLRAILGRKTYFGVRTIHRMYMGYRIHLSRNRFLDTSPASCRPTRLEQEPSR